MQKMKIGRMVLLWLLALSFTTARAQQEPDIDYGPEGTAADSSDTLLTLGDFIDQAGEALASYSEEFAIDPGDTDDVPSCLVNGTCPDQLSYSVGEKPEGAAGESSVFPWEEDPEETAALKTAAEEEAKQFAFDWQQQTLNEYFDALFEGAIRCDSGNCQSFEPPADEVPADDPWWQFVYGDELPEWQP